MISARSRRQSNSIARQPHLAKNDTHGRQLRFVARLHPARLLLAAVTPLNDLLLQAIEIAKRREPGLSDSEIAYRAGITQPTLSRAKKRCGPSTLSAVLDTLGIDLVLATSHQPVKRGPGLVAHRARPAYAGSTPGLHGRFSQKAQGR